MTIERLTFVYDADGSLVGEVRYWVGTLFGAEHCSLCDITHSRWGRRKEFQECAARLGVPIDYLHRDDVPDAVRAAVPRWPAVVGHDDRDGVHLLLDAAALDAMHGDPAVFEAALREALAQRSS
jgi:hypothetical protein